MQSDQRIISQLEEAVASSERLLAETKNRHKATVSGLRAEQRNEIEQLQTQVRDYAKALKAVAKSNGLENKEKRRQIRAQRAIWGLRRAIMRKGGNVREYRPTLMAGQRRPCRGRCGPSLPRLRFHCRFQNVPGGITRRPCCIRVARMLRPQQEPPRDPSKPRLVNRL